MSSMQEKGDTKVLVLGSVDSGKSSLIGVLAYGTQDDGKGLSRSKSTAHKHEEEVGRTSTISYHTTGFDTQKQWVPQTVSASAKSQQKDKSCREVFQKSERLFTFVDLAGHERYLKTTISGMTGSRPDYAVIIVGSNRGVLKMTKEHIGVAISLNIPFACIMTKTDLTPTDIFTKHKEFLFKLLKSPLCSKMPYQIKSMKDAETVKIVNTMCPIFTVSSVTMYHIDYLTRFLYRLTERKEEFKEETNDLTEFEIDETFTVTGIGLVVSGTVVSGTLKENDTMLLGPFSDKSFCPVQVKTIHCKRVPVPFVTVGTFTAVAIKLIHDKVVSELKVQNSKMLTRDMIRKAMMLVSPNCQNKPTWVFKARVHILHHPTTIKEKYQAVIHNNKIRQTASLENIVLDDNEKEEKSVSPRQTSTKGDVYLRTGSKATVEFHFHKYPELMKLESQFVFREGTTRGVGTVVEILDAHPQPNTIQRNRVQKRRNRPRRRRKK